MNNRNPRNYTILTDDYELKMSGAYLENNKEKTDAVFDVFFRRVPNYGGYVVMAGLDKIIDYIKNLKFTDEDIEYLKNCGYSDIFLKYLKNFKFTGDIYAIPDGTPVFPNEPLLTVVSPIIESQIIETALLSMINGSTEHATGARRIMEAVPNNVKVMEFGARRADGLEAAIDSSIYALMAGCHGTSNVMAAKMLNMNALGTMAHSFVETFDNEFEAFKAFAKVYPENTILLVDTYDTLRSGIPNAIKAFNWMKTNGINTNHIGIRIDSGDLAYLSKKAREMLDAAGYKNATICLSNGLDDKKIESLVKEGAIFDSLGVGDNISKPNGRMGAVYKEVATINNGIITPKIKVSDDVFKTVNPNFKNLYRAYDKNTGYALADIMCNKNEKINKDNLTIVSLNNYISEKTLNDFELVKLQKPIFLKGKLVYNEPSLKEKREYCEKQMATLYPEVKRINNPHQYYVDGTLEYANFKKDMINKVRKIGA